MKLSKEIKTAILVIVGILFFVFGFNYLKGKNLLDSSRTFYTVYDNVEGLAPSTPVTISGLPVGRVQSIGFTDDGSSKLLVKLLVTTDYKFSKNSKAQLYEAGLIGGKAIAIVPAFDNAEEAEDGDTLEADIKAGLSELVNQRLTPLQEKIETMMVSADSLLNNINDVFDSKTKDNLRKGIADMSATMSSFKETSASINSLLKSNQERLNNTLANAESMTNNLNSITDSIAKADLGKTIEELQGTIGKFNNVMASIENGEGSIGKLLKDEGLYNNLEGASKQLEQLLQDMKLNPKRYVHFSLFGKKPGDYDAEKNEKKDNGN
ncbi:MAG TPA: MlaD family protein [Flavobacteriaceae bacterium]|nr:MlaD family protein [Flavobacteriaceae bacterium]